MRFANQLYTDGVITVGKPSVAWMVEKNGQNDDKGGREW